MKLVCPSCESGFLVDATAIGPTGRKVRCGRCGNSWLAMPVEAVPEHAIAEAIDPDEALAGQTVSDVAPGPVRAGSGEDRDEADRDRTGWAVEQATVVEEPVNDGGTQADDSLRRAAGFDRFRPRSRSSRRMPQREPKRGASLGGWALFALCVAALGAGLVFGRHHIMAWAPETEALYVMAGLAEEAPIPPLPSVHLRLREVTSGRRQVDGASELVIEGEIFNPTDQPQDVPPLVATLMDPTGIELKRWVFAAETETLPPGGHAAFQTSTPDPPGQGNLNLNFVLQQP
jgi:predicted Zn finger-like uncharacterized protein